ncbi:putative Xylulose kinase [Vibrio nigripulchritudo SFn27]|uniref:Xylulose kinase n=1 Tax=Vibrio nigripulchritudo TaxID=28173 RepID=U4JXH6_9VIBR|nr:xylulokinase [Vibrio nigripulchritudo]CCN85238.1 putative Xylulose kinase [Vibrio nigripulchritudo BLFn1]CCN87612.1 putative Xylulose kinase [Vibrio nigripulchritudo SFn27]CCN92493.1 putative Xylulose kinase [Vibrio nigripulchritudo ENn2]CCO39356.1 putative Xylulose kinase [Vibrio nigripulchritudo SFn135]CCO53416.1 putative Xylulose kinase [Vibrio nigripulchritudo Wn13]
MSSGFLGIDIGTSACKVVLLDENGNIIASQTQAYGFEQPFPGWVEQDPESWIQAATNATKRVLSKSGAPSVSCVGLSGQMHGLTPLDSNFKVIRPAILWNDQRNKAESDAIHDHFGGAEKLAESTSNQMLVGYTGGKILWMKNHEPDNYQKLRHVLNPKDYLRLILTGELATEVSDASGTGLFSVANRVWAWDVIDSLGIERSLLPSCYESSVISGKVSASAAQIFGIPAGTPVIGGGGDAVIQTFGSGVVRPGELQTTIGTAGILATALSSPISNPQGKVQVFCNLSPDKWHCMGVSLNAGSCLTWLSRLIQSFGVTAPDYKSIAKLAIQSSAGANGLLMMPYLNGERCPHPDPDARGAFVGLNSTHQAPDLCRAVMEGVAYSLYDIYSLMNSMGINGNVIKASGGGAQSSLWRQIQADLFDAEVQTVSGAAEGAAFGAAMLAGVGIGHWSSLEEASLCCKEITTQSPDKENQIMYRDRFKAYQALYPLLSHIVQSLNSSGETAL